MRSLPVETCPLTRERVERRMRNNKLAALAATVSLIAGSVIVLGNQNTDVLAEPAKSVVFNFDNPPIVLTHPFVTIAGEYTAPGDSLRVIMQWEQPKDGLGNADSTIFTFASTKSGVFQRANFQLAANVKARRKFGPTVLADTFKLLKPAIGDSVIFTVDTIYQCRKGACSVPGSAAWGYVRTAAPPSMTFIKVSVDSFP